MKFINANKFHRKSGVWAPVLGEGTRGTNRRFSHTLLARTLQDTEGRNLQKHEFFRKL
jgi:hypothetical protein